MKCKPSKTIAKAIYAKAQQSNTTCAMMLRFIS